MRFLVAALCRNDKNGRDFLKYEVISYMIFKDIDLHEAHKDLMHAKEHHRTQEEIIKELKEEVKELSEREFLVFLMRIYAEMESRATSPLFKHLQSPMKQILYLIDVYYSVRNKSGKEIITESKWDSISFLLGEMELAYFVSIGFDNNGNAYHDERGDKVEVSLAVFMNHFSNCRLCYEEQTLDRLKRHCTLYDKEIKNEFGFTINDAITFSLHMRTLTNQKYTKNMLAYAQTYKYFYENPDIWSELTDVFAERGFKHNEWILQPELTELREHGAMSPGELFLHSKEKIESVKINKQALQDILKFICYNKEELCDKVVYYAENHVSEKCPLVPLNGEYACLGSKFLLEAFYYRLDAFLQKNVIGGQKYKERKDTTLENKVLTIFKKFFGNKTLFFSNYSVDGKSENDLLIIYKDSCFIVEVKNCSFREPFREPIKAYDRIKSDFAKAVQLGYEQCKRVEDVFYSDTYINIIDGQDMKTILHRLNGRKIQRVFSIVVTEHKYGPIQTNLERLLKKNEKDLYPWSVCVDDLEIFLILLKRLKKGIAAEWLIDFLDYREGFHEHLICFDELELCGLFLCQKDQFKKCSEMDGVVNTFGGMGEIFDAYYHIGLGFENELDSDIKRNYKLKDYAKSFNIETVQGRDVLSFQKETLH